MFEMLQSQGVARNQQVTFLSGGGDDVRQVQQYLEPGGGVLAGLILRHDTDQGDETDGQGLGQGAKSSADRDGEPAAGPEEKRSRKSSRV